MLEANVYDLNADKLIYSAQTRSVDPELVHSRSQRNFSDEDLLKT